ncbi:hypothetical protein SynBIOSE41_03116 [Synechococcus sp. BIOS-E4-1]|nr:hypothetical protein SynBIOSE41_03116 [Synechococcus sp. BIOS-E4-1]
MIDKLLKATRPRLINGRERIWRDDQCDQSFWSSRKELRFQIVLVQPVGAWMIFDGWDWLFSNVEHLA